MNRKEILERIDTIKRELAEDQFDIIKDKILERKFHHHKSNRKFLMRRLIESLRRRLVLELELILEPLLENQKEVNLRLLEEIKRLKKEVSAIKTGEDADKNASESQKPDPENQE